MKTTVTLGAVAAVVLAGAAARGQAPEGAAGAPAGGMAIRSIEGPAAGVSESLRREAAAAVARGAAWLKSQQNADGHWSNPAHPALTALPVWALALAGEGTGEAAKKGVAHIRSCAKENGAIFVEPGGANTAGGMANYNTALCMVALKLAGGPDAVPAIQKAREFVARSQHLGGDVYFGGMGYDAGTGRAYADLSNSYIAYEAMRMTESVEDLRTSKEARADLDWKAAQEFIQKTQNDPSVNPQPWASDDPSERGGFVYTPEQTRAGTSTNRQGIVKFRSMRGMTYAGLLSYIYAEVDRNDPRVEATVNWAVSHWSLDANNPLMAGRTPDDKVATNDEREGLYYLYSVMAKGLAAYGKDVFRPKTGAAFNWRVELIEKLLALQKTEAATGHGYWVNDVGRYWESDPVLVTSYALLALQTALGE
jgi:squalene-hopene/tetraprenyl-beta-curcumene cyclase